MTVRGGGIPRRPLALTPNGRMGPPLRSFAADAHDCIMVRVLGPTGYKVVARLTRARKASSTLIVIATALSVPSCSKPSRYGLARAKHAARLVRRPILTASARIDLSDARVGMKKRTLRSNQETDEGKRCAALANSLTKKAPYKGLGAESGEKREPASDIDTAVVDSLKALDPEWPIREADIAGRGWHGRKVPTAVIGAACAPTRFADRNVMEYWPDDHSGLILAARITLPHFSLSSAINFPKSAGEAASAVPPRLASRPRLHADPAAGDGELRRRPGSFRHDHDAQPRDRAMPSAGGRDPVRWLRRRQGYD